MNLDNIWRKANKTHPPIDHLWDKRGNPEVEEKLCLTFMYLVAQITKPGDEEAASEGMLALIQAVRKFDPEKGFLPQTYIARSIQRAVWKVYQKRNKTEGIVSTHGLLNDEELDIEADDFEAEILERAAMEQLLKELPSEQHEQAMVLKADGELVVDIAAILGVSKHRTQQIFKESRQSINLKN